MKKKLKKFALLLICICISSSLIFSLSLSAPFPFTTSLTDKDAIEQTTYTSYPLLRNFTNTGDFIQWYNLSMNWNYLQTAGDRVKGYLYLHNTQNPESKTCQAARYFPHYNTSIFLTHYSFHLRLFTTYSVGYNVYLKAYFTDNTSAELLHVVSTNPIDYTYYIDLNATYGKLMDYLFLQAYIGVDPQQDTNALLVELLDESYFGKKLSPLIPSVAPSMFRIASPVVFNCKTDLETFYDGSFPASEIAAYITLLYNETGLYKNFQMVQDWTAFSFCQTLYFNVSGVYLFKIFLTSLFFQYITETSFYAIKAYSADELIYPAPAKLTLWSPLGLAIPTNLKVYLGNSETFELYMPEINKTLPFQAYAANSTARLIHFTEYENKISVQSKMNGIKANIPPTNGLYPNTELFESLVFDFRLKAYQGTPLFLIGLNYFQADYNLNLNSTYLTQWVQYIIPISFFNWHNYSAALAQLIFYSANYLSYEIKNIYVADYKNITAILSNAQNSTIQYEQSTQSKLGTITAFTNQSYTSQANWQNITTSWENHSYSLICGNNSGSQVSQHVENQAAIPSWNNQSAYKLETNFDVSGYSSENITILSNQTIELTKTKLFPANDTFTNEPDYSFPDYWADDYNGAGRCFISSKDGHAKVLKFTDNISDYVGIKHIYGKTSMYEIVSFWVFSADYSDYINIEFWNGYDFPVQIAISRATSSYLCYYDSSFHNVCPLTNSHWYRITFTYNLDTASHYGLAHGTCNFKVLDNTTGYETVYGTYNVRGSYETSGVTFMRVNDWSAGGADTLYYFDAFDWDWSNGYVAERNLNSTHFSAGYYQSPVYQLTSADAYYWQTFAFSRVLLSGTGLSAQYRYSSNNITWDAWTSGYTTNQTINTLKGQYYQFRVNLTSAGDNKTSLCEYVNLTYQRCDTSYRINETNYFNFTSINKANIFNITLDANIEANRFLACNSYITTSIGGSHNTENDYTYTWENDSLYYAAGGFTVIPNAANAYMYLEINASLFSASTSLTFCTKYAASWTAKQEANCSIYCFGNSTWYELSYSTTDNLVKYVEQTLSNAQNFINSTGFMKVRFGSGMGENNPWTVYNLRVYYLEIFDASPICTLKIWNFTSSTYTTLNLGSNLTNYALSTDYFNTTHVQMQFNITKTHNFYCNHNFTIKITYFYYINASFTYYYALPIADAYFFYQFALNSTLQGQTATYFKWRTSTDNITWDNWSSATNPINLFKYRYLNYQINCNTTWAYNYSTFNAANLQYSKRSILCHYLIVNSTTNFIAANFLKNVTLNANRLSNINNLLNSSLNIYKFSTSTYQNISAINAFCQFNVTNNYYNSTKHVLLQIKIYSSQAFTFQFKQVELWRYDYLYNKTCYLAANFTLKQIDFHLFYSTFNAPSNQSLIYLYLYNSSTQIKYTVKLSGNMNLTTTLILLADPTLVKLKFKFVYYNASSDTNLTALITRYFFVYNQTYRLFCDANRQATDFITFTQDLQTLCLTDYFGTIVYKHLFNRTTQGYFLDVQLNFFEVTFSNYVPDSMVTFSLTNRHLTINLTLDYAMSMAIPLFTDDYLVVLFHTENKTVINVWDLTISAIRNRKFAYNISIPITPVARPPDYGWMYYLLFIPAFLLLVIAYQQIKKRRSLPKKVKKAITTEGTPQNKKKKLKKKKKNELYV